MPRITRKVAGKDVEVPLDSVWPSICKVISLARMAAFPVDSEKYLPDRLAYLWERLTDLEDLELHAKYQ